MILRSCVQFLFSPLQKRASENIELIQHVLLRVWIPGINTAFELLSTDTQILAYSDAGVQVLGEENDGFQQLKWSCAA